MPLVETRQPATLPDWSGSLRRRASSQSQALMLCHDLAVTGYRSTAVARGRKGCWNPEAERLRMSKCLPLPKEQTSVR